MRIAHIVWSLQVGGLETMVVDIINHQVKTNDVMLVIINSIVDEAVLNGLDKKASIVLVNRPAGSKNVWHLLRLNQALFRFWPDVIHAHQESIIRLIFGHAAIKVLTVHGTNLAITDATYRYDKIFSISEAVKKDLIDRSPACPSKVVLNGISFLGIRQKASYAVTPFRIVQVGRLEHQTKGQDILLYALRQVLAEAGNGSVEVDFIGAGKSSEYLRQLAVELHVERYCRFLGIWSRERIYSELHTYDLLVQPSRCEGFGLTIVEGMGAHVPVLVSDITGPMDIIQYGKYGYHFRSGDARDCARQIMRVAVDSHKSEFPTRMQSIGDYARTTFGVGQTAGIYLQAYQSL